MYFTEETYAVIEDRTIPLSLTIKGDVSLDFKVEIIVKPGGTAEAIMCMIKGMNFIIERQITFNNY